jgi:hypothetical protein
MPTIQFPDDTQKQAYWDEHKPPRSPDKPDNEMIGYLESKIPGEDWDKFCSRINSVRMNYERAADVSMCIHGSDKFIVGSDSDGIKSSFDELLSNSSPIWRSAPSIGYDTWVRWSQLAGIFHFFPSTLDERTAEFHWSRVRCFLAGAGYKHHSGLSEEISANYPGCPLSSEETEKQWNEALLKAHSTCGWPAQLAWLPWRKVVSLLGAVDDPPPMWLKMLGLLHVLKHTRASASQGVIVHYAGTSTIIPEERTNAIGTWTSGKSSLLSALGCGLPGGRTKIPVATVALQSVLARLEINHLLRKTPLASLPANLLAGPWTMPVPDHSSHDGFYQTGLRLSGLWAATNGRVTKESLGQAEVIEYDWNCKNPASYAEERKLFASGLPDTYKEEWPSTVFLGAFPNFDLSWAPGPELNEAVKAIVDVPIAASLIRGTNPEFRQEYPAVVFMPTNPSPSDSTNQGKSQATLVYARACNPAITRLVSINDSSSAPDIRTVAGEIRATGSIAIDEFRPPKNSTHIFSHDNMQALCTGSGVASGRVYENEGTVSLRSSPVFSAKVYEVPPDIQNRSLAHWLGPLTDQMRSRSKVLDEIRSGAISLKMRLGMHAINEKTDLIDRYRKAGRQSSSRGLRFDAHRTLAACILSQRTSVSMDVAYAQLDRVCEMMQNKLRSHVQAAVDTGLVAAMEFGTALKLRLSYLFDDMAPDEFTKFRQLLNVMAAGRPGGVGSGSTAKELLLAWGSLHNLDGKPFQDYLQILTGSKRSVSNRAVVMALNASIHELAPQEGSQWFLPGDNGTINGYVMRRGKGDMVHFISLHPGAPT